MAKIYTIIILLASIFIYQSDIYAQTGKKSSVSNFTEVQINEFEIKAFPNPVKSGEYISIEFSNFQTEKPVSIALINIIGKQLINIEIDTMNYKLHITKEKFPAGIYILKAKQDNKIRTMRLNVVQ